MAHHMEDKLKAEIIESLAEILQRDPLEIEEGMNLRDGLGVDSLDTVELLMEAEEKFDIEIDSSELDPEKVVTVRDLIEFVKERIR